MKLLDKLLSINKQKNNIVPLDYDVKQEGQKTAARICAEFEVSQYIHKHLNKHREFDEKSQSIYPNTQFIITQFINDFHDLEKNKNHLENLGDIDTFFKITYEQELQKRGIKFKDHTNPAKESKTEIHQKNNKQNTQLTVLSNSDYSSEYIQRKKNTQSKDYFTSTSMLYSSWSKILDNKYIVFLGESDRERAALEPVPFFARRQAIPSWYEGTKGLFDIDRLTKIEIGDFKRDEKLHPVRGLSDKKSLLSVHSILDKLTHGRVLLDVVDYSSAQAGKNPDGSYFFYYLHRGIFIATMQSDGNPVNVFNFNCEAVLAGLDSGTCCDRLRCSVSLDGGYVAAVKIGKNRNQSLSVWNVDSPSSPPLYGEIPIEGNLSPDCEINFLSSHDFRYSGSGFSNIYHIKPKNPPDERREQKADANEIELIGSFSYLGKNSERIYFDRMYKLLFSASRKYCLVTNGCCAFQVFQIENDLEIKLVKQWEWERDIEFPDGFWIGDSLLLTLPRAPRVGPWYSDLYLVYDITADASVPVSQGSNKCLVIDGNGRIISGYDAYHYEKYVKVTSVKYLRNFDSHQVDLEQFQRFFLLMSSFIISKDDCLIIFTYLAAQPIIPFNNAPYLIPKWILAMTLDNLIRSHEKRQAKENRYKFLTAKGMIDIELLILKNFREQDIPNKKSLATLLKEISQHYEVSQHTIEFGKFMAYVEKLDRICPALQAHSHQYNHSLSRARI